jgi:hypothetical protein
LLIARPASTTRDEPAAAPSEHSALAAVVLQVTEFDEIDVLAGTMFGDLQQVYDSGES